MGPQSLDCGRQSAMINRSAVFCGFNGAAVTRLRKVAPWLTKVGWYFSASMGPQSLDCGRSTTKCFKPV